MRIIALFICLARIQRSVALPTSGEAESCSSASRDRCASTDQVELLQRQVDVATATEEDCPEASREDLTGLLQNKVQVKMTLENNEGVAIPKQIFAFWDTPTLPKLVGLCVHAIRKTNPDWKVTVLSPANLTNPPEPEPAGFDKLKIQHKVDWLRLVLLKQYGGVWLDASIVPLKPVTSWVDLSIHAVQGFETPWYEPDCHCQILENWAIAAPAGNALVETWLREFERAIAMGFEVYQKELMSWGQIRRKTFTVIGDYLPYITQHAAFMRVHMAHQLYPVIMHSSYHGPLWFVVPSNYSSSKAADMLTSIGKDHCALLDVPFIKLPGSERRDVEHLLKAKNYTGNSVMHSALGLLSSNLVEKEFTLTQSISATLAFVVNTGAESKCAGATRASVSALGMQTIELAETGEDVLSAALRHNVSEAAVRFANSMPSFTQHLLAHASAWKRVIDGNVHEALVIEAGISLSSSSEKELCSLLSRRPLGSLFQLAIQPAVQFGDRSAGSCCESSRDGDCLSWKPGGEYGSQVYLVTRAAAIELYTRLQTGGLMWPTTDPVSYALRTASDAYHLRMPSTQQSKTKPVCGKALDIEGCSSAVHVGTAVLDHADYVLAAACAKQISNQKDTVRKAGFAIPENGQNTADVEGGSSFNEATYLGELVRKLPSNSTLCQTGFNYGTSALAMLCAAGSGVKLYSWDLGEHPYVTAADAVIQSKFEKRHFLTLGDSTVTLKEAIAGKGPLPSNTMCDFVFVDGGHSLDVAKADILNFKLLARPGSMLVVDDCGEIGKQGADEAVSNAFVQAVADGQVVPDAEAALGLHTQFHSAARSICVGHYS